MRSANNEERFPDGLQEVADLLREERPALALLELDRVKLRAMSRADRSTRSRERGSFVRSHLTALLTVGFLAAGTGGALATAGDDLGSGRDHGGSAGFHEYRCDRQHDERCRCENDFSFGRDGRCQRDDNDGRDNDDKGGGEKGGKGGGDKGAKGGGDKGAKAGSH